VILIPRLRISEREFGPRPLTVLVLCGLAPRYSGCRAVLSAVVDQLRGSETNFEEIGSRVNSTV
jgi:hypothetical protein